MTGCLRGYYLLYRSMARLVRTADGQFVMIISTSIMSAPLSGIRPTPPPLAIEPALFRRIAEGIASIFRGTGRGVDAESSAVLESGLVNTFLQEQEKTIATCSASRYSFRKGWGGSGGT